MFISITVICALAVVALAALGIARTDLNTMMGAIPVAHIGLVFGIATYQMRTYQNMPPIDIAFIGAILMGMLLIIGTCLHIAMAMVTPMVTPMVVMSTAGGLALFMVYFARALAGEIEQVRFLMR